MQVKNKPIYIVTHEEPKNSYWDKAVISGIKDAARESQCVVKMVDLSSIDNFDNSPLIIASSRGVWVCQMVSLAISKGANPIVASSVEFPYISNKHNRVVFEFETVIDKCISYLEDAGRTKTVLLGVAPKSAGDKIKCDAFKNRGDIFWEENGIEVCVEEFIKLLDNTEYDSIICANDTIAVLLEQRLLESGYNVPEDFYIIGMGNSYVGQNISVPLTSITLDYYEIGKMAVSLYKYISECNFDCQINAKIPCKLEIRESAPFNKITDKSSVVPGESPNLEKYFCGDRVQSIISAETLIQNCDDIDKVILIDLSKGKSVEKIAERLYLSERAVRYRISNLVKRNDFLSREEMESMLKMAISNDIKER